jgi:hypothetical protein
VAAPQSEQAECERLLGLEPGDLGGTQGAEELAVWLENWPAVEIFGALQTQWTVAPSGSLVGLRYEALPLVFNLHRIRRRRRRRLFEDLRIMETAVLTALQERRP